MSSADLAQTIQTAVAALCGTAFLIALICAKD